MPGTATYDPTTPIGQVRLLALDWDTSNAIFADADLQALINMKNGNVLYAAASALDIIAANEAFVQKRLRILDIQTDGQVTAEALHAQAMELRRQAEIGEGDPVGIFDWAEMVVDQFAERERILKQFAREAFS